VTWHCLKRLLQGIPTIFALATVTFFIMRLAPGGPFAGNRQLPKAILENMERSFHLDEPIWMQFLRYLWNAVRFDFGPSMTYRDYSVARLIVDGASASVEIGLMAMLVATIAGLALGTAAAVRRNTAVDYTSGFIAVAGLAVPIFVIGPLMQLVLGLRLGWLPVAGWDGTWKFKVLPVIVLALPNIGYIARLMRGSMIEVLRADYVRTARAKGMGVRLVLWRHAFRSAIVPVVAYLGPATAITITGSVVIEQVFQVPGIGRYFVIGAINRDYTLVMGVTLFYGTIIILANAITDIAQGLLDPRIRYE
jgi:oligopeptide transport system permease protein